MADNMLKFSMALHTSVLRLSRGRLGAGSGMQSFLVLYTTGRKSGKRRVTPIAYFTDNGNYYLIASNWGKDQNASWYYNLKSHPQAMVEIRGKKIPVLASEAPAEDYERLWQAAVSHNPGYNDYKAGTSRHIPIMVLAPTK